ncbi:GIY-YIG nuclease family protein [Patescibacteria group bacterium]|nr:GIY-YIG nuclease family protein [Patescibacteria group bacterium]
MYVGYSTDLRQRVKSHLSKQVISTSYRMPAKLLYYEGFLNKLDAKSREVFLKSGSGRKQLRSILKNTFKGKV